MSLYCKATRLQPQAWRFVAHFALASAAALMVAGADLLGPLVG